MHVAGPGHLSAPTDRWTCTIHQARLRDLRGDHLGLLSPGERERRSRLARTPDRDRFTLGAAVLRLAVARWTGTDPAALEVTRHCERCGGDHGRPRLGGGLHASVSHSADLVVVALTAAGPVGIDVERVGVLPSADLVSSVCTPPERAAVQTPDDFFTTWVRKEAVLKATGEGLQAEMSDVVVTRPDREPALLSLRGRPSPACSMAEVRSDGYAGAVAVLAPDGVDFSFA